MEFGDRLVTRARKVLAVASGGGHWIQLLRMRPAFGDCDVRFITTIEGLDSKVAPMRCDVVPDASMDSKARLALMAMHVLWRILLFRPHVVISTGAAPGFFALAFGKLVGARTIWIDSIANADELSLAGRKIGRWADHWLTQWPELSKPDGPHYIGNVL
jgi:hypothetical protein